MINHFKAIVFGYTMWVPFNFEFNLENLIIIRIDYNGPDEERAICDFFKGYDGEYASKVDNLFNEVWIGAAPRNSIIDIDIGLRFDLDYDIGDMKSYIYDFATYGL